MFVLENAPRLTQGLRGAQRLLPQGRVPADRLDLLDHEARDLARGDRLGGAGVPAALLGAGAGVVAVAAVAFGGVSRGHRTAARGAAQQTLEQRTELVPH